MRRGRQPHDARRAQVLAVLADGPRTQAELAGQLGVRKPAVSKILSAMLARRDVRLAPSIRATGHGPWPMRYVVARQQHDGSSLDPARVAPEERSHRPPAGVLPSGECKVSTK